MNAIDEAAGKGVGFMPYSPRRSCRTIPYFSFVEPPVLHRQGAHLKLYDEAVVVVPGPVTQALSAAAKESRDGAS